MSKVGDGGESFNVSGRAFRSFHAASPHPAVPPLFYSLQSALTVETPAGSGGEAAGLFVPQGTVLRTESGPVDVPVVVDLIHYSVTDHTLAPLPGNGAGVSEAGRVQNGRVVIPYRHPLPVLCS